MSSTLSRVIFRVGGEGATISPRAVTAALLVADNFRGHLLTTFSPSPTIQARADVPPGVSHLVTPEFLRGIPIPVPWE